MRAVEQGQRPLRPQVLEILYPARGQHGAEQFRRRVVNELAEGVGQVHAVVLRQPLLHLQLQAMVGRVAVGEKRHQVASIETGRGKRRDEVRPGRNHLG